MAAPTKNKRNVENISNDISFKISSADKQDASLKAFLIWCKHHGILLSDKVRIGQKGSCAQYGMIATDDIMRGESVFEIPRSILLHEKSSTIANILNEGSKELASVSGWVPLLITLMYEYNNPESMWRPYLDLVPDFKELNLPLFWTSADRNSLLKGTGVIEAVEKDEKSIKNEFNSLVLPFIRKHPQTFLPICQDITFYQKMVSFIMAYSFTEENVNDEITNSVPMMVPVADILNSVANNNAHLMYETNVLKMIAIKDISKDEEIFNSYGQPDNAHLLQMYGYAEEYPKNHNDTVEIPVSVIVEIAKSILMNQEEKSRKAKLEYLESMSEDYILIDTDGILTDYECEKILKVIFTSKTDFEESSEEDSDEEEESNKFHFVNIPLLSDNWKEILHKVAAEKLKRYNTTLEEDQQKTAQEISTLPSHHKYSFYTSYGQKMLLKRLMDCCK